jgi:hypothetical protein
MSVAGCGSGAMGRNPRANRCLVRGRLCAAFGSNYEQHGSQQLQSHRRSEVIRRKDSRFAVRR